MAKPVITSKRRLPWKKIFMIGGGIVLVLGIGYAVALTKPGAEFYTMLGEKAQDITGANTDKDGTTEGEDAESQPINDAVFSGAVSDIQAGNTEGAVRRYVQQADSRQDTAEKAESYLSLSLVLSGYGNNPDQALQYALKSFQTEPSAQAAAQLSTLYREMGNEAEALKYDEYVSSALEQEGYNGHDS